VGEATAVGLMIAAVTVISRASNSSVSEAASTSAATGLGGVRVRVGVAVSVGVAVRVGVAVKVGSSVGVAVSGGGRVGGKAGTFATALLTEPLGEAASSGGLVLILTVQPAVMIAIKTTVLSKIVRFINGRFL